MQFRDAMRAQYYLKKLQREANRLKETTNDLKNIWPNLDPEKIINPVMQQLADQIDQILLPVVAYEISEAREDNFLRGKTAEKRYDSFFIRNQTWTSRARQVGTKYPFLFEMIKRFLSSAVDNLCQGINALRRDVNLLRNNFSVGAHPLTEITIPNSDRHCGGNQALIFSFSSGKRIVFKPTNLWPDKLFADFVRQLDLPSPYNLRCMKVLPRTGYGWIEYIRATSCQITREIENYYRRAGVLLAITDSLNYCDGHLDNLIASGAYPTLIDCETLFHNFGEVDPEIGERSILFTGLIEKPPEPDSGRGFTAAYDIISQKSKKILSNIEWWNQVAKVRSRQLVRHTLYYQLLIRKCQQPEACLDKKAATKIIQSLLASDESFLQVVSEYELASLLKLDIPYFYHHSGELHLYNGDSGCYRQYFDTPAIEEMRRNFRERSDDYKKRSVEILYNVLPASPSPKSISAKS